MINKINKETRRSINAILHDPRTRGSGKEPRRTPKQKQDSASSVQLLVNNNTISVKFGNNSIKGIWNFKAIAEVSSI
jgi:hypothetical protein